jgi:exodeoxyribonuclease V alpha subunit
MDPKDRAGSHILKIAEAIREGKAPPFSEGELALGVVRRVSSPNDASEGVSSLALRDESARDAWLSWWYEHRVRGADEMRRLMDRSFVLESDAEVLRTLFSWLESSRLLCVTRGRATGADTINALLGARFRQERKMGSGSLLLVGEPVMVVRNDYDRGLFNGDQGLVLWVKEEPSASARPSLVVRRGEHFVSHRIESVHLLLERAYASTVHKAQGSEHDRVALLLPGEDVPRLLTREIVYTAITRARRSVLLVGSSELLAKAIARPAARTTGLARLLDGGQDPPT